MADSKTLLNAYLIIGEDELKREGTLKKLRARVAEMGDIDFNSDTFDGQSASGMDIVAACQVVPFASDVRLVVVTSVDALAKQDSDPLVDYLKDPNPTTILCLEGPKLAKNTRLYKAVAALGKQAVVECVPAKKYELPAQVRSMATSRGIVMTEASASRLIELVGENTVHIDAELAKLALAHKGNQPVSVSEIEELVARTSEAKPWEFSDAFANRDLARCIELLNQMDSVSPYYLLSMCEGRIRELLTCHGLARRGIRDVKQWAAYLNKRDWQVKNHLTWAKKWGTSELRHALSSARDCEKKMKSTSDADGAFLDWIVDVLVKKPKR